MALTDLKSDLSKFRRPVEKSILDNQSVEINRTSNLTPLSDLSKRLSSPNPLKETPVKSVVTPTPVDTTERFKGQTTPNDFDFSPQFTTPKLSSVDFFPNTNADGFTARMRESRFNFSSLSSPTPMTLEGRFLGETDPNRMSLESQFLGETTPNLANNTEKFKGQTTPNEVDDTEKFKGETSPSNFTFTPQFTATTPPNFTFTPQFTTPTLKIVDFIPNIDAKGFTDKMKQVPSQFVDVSRDQRIFTERTLNSKLGVVDFFTNNDAKGFTKNFSSVTDSQFTGINGTTFTSNKLTTKLGTVDFFSNENGVGFTKNFDRATPSQFTGINGITFKSNKPTTKLRAVNFFFDDDAKGFTKNFVDKTKSQFTGISGETFISPKVTFSGDFGLSFLPGSKIKLEGSAAKYYQVGSQKWQPGGKRYEDKYVSIGDLLISENSPSYLTKVYSQFNLQDDSFNPYPLFFRQPFILRGIQRKPNSKKEPQKWGLGNVDSIMGVDLIRGGVTTSTERAVVDVARIGKFILSPKGIVWSIMQVGMQLTNTYNKVWTPLNLLLAVGGQHLGFKPKRHGLLPFDKIDEGNYERPDGHGIKIMDEFGYVTKLKKIYKPVTKLLSFTGFNKIPIDSQFGGPESVYGIGISNTFTSTNTFGNTEKTKAHQKAEFKQKYGPGPPIGLISNTYGKEFGVTKGNVGSVSTKSSFLEGKKYDEVTPKSKPQSGYEQMWESNNQSSQKLKEIFGGDEILNYNQIRNFAESGPYTSFNDFRIKYKDNNPPLLPGKKAKLKREIKDYGDDYYTKYNIVKRVSLGNSDNTSIGTREFSNNDPDLIKLIFSDNTVGDIQFRGTVNSISETYSPNWTEIKYSGRAENAYIYDTFGRELNFGFRVYAYSVKELLPMWKKLDKLGRMSMPTYIGDAGYYGNITKFTLGTMYTNFPALISSLQYSVPDEFTWEIGLNAGSGGNELPMGVDVTIGLKLLGKSLHAAENTPIYDYNYKIT